MSDDPFNFDHVMTVARVREALTELSDDMIVVLASDAEGNSHSPLSCIDQAMYLPDSTYSGDVYATPEELTEPGNDYDPEEDAAPQDAVRCLLLGPVN